MNYDPQNIKPHLHQWDNYQIHDLNCSDTIYLDLVLRNGYRIPATPDQFENFLAVERFNPETVPVDFDDFISRYH